MTEQDVKLKEAARAAFEDPQHPASIATDPHLGEPPVHEVEHCPGLQAGKAITRFACLNCGRHHALPHGPGTPASVHCVCGRKLLLGKATSPA